MQPLNARTMALCALFAALSAALSQLSIPIGPVPVNFVHVSVFLAAGLLGAKYGALSQLVFVLMGLAGVPVFSGFSGGIQKLFGPTGGFIAGYIACAFVAGYFMERSGTSVMKLALSMGAGLFVTYAPGLIWYRIVMKADIRAAFFACVFFFLPGDVLKTAVCAVLVNRLKPILARAGKQRG